MKKIFFLAFLMALALVLSSAALAQDETALVEVVSEDSADTDIVLELEGLKVAEPAAIPSNWGLFWRGLRERVSVALTLDPVKKAEKRLKFAEERMRLAEYIIEKSQDPKIQARAEKMLEKSQALMAKVEENKDKWIENQDERARRLMKNVLTHQLRREQVMDKLEEKLPRERLEHFQELKEEAAEKGERLLNAIENSNAPAAVREHLQNVKERIETQAAVVEQYREQKQEILQKVKSGDETAREELRILNVEKKQTLEQMRIDFKEKRRELSPTIQEDSVEIIEAVVVPVNQ